MSTILAAAGDPGGAAALAPALEYLHGRNGLGVRALAYSHAQERWKGAQFPCETLARDTDDAQLDDAVRNADLLLAGTSALNGADFEKRLTALFRRHGKPSVVVLDYWSHYARRFTDAQGRLVLPDRVTAIDEVSRRGLVAAGIPADRIVVTGHPGLDALESIAHGWSVSQRRETRSALGVDNSEWLVLFAAHPAGPSGDADTAVDRLTHALDALGVARRQRIALLVRPHPKEARRKLPPQRELQGVRVWWSAAEDARHVALASDIVTGVDTMLLVEACYMGCPTLAIRDNDDALDDGPYGSLIPVCRSENELRDRLSALAALAHQPRAPLAAASGDAELSATQRLAQLVFRLLR